MAVTRKYPEELRERATRMAFDARRDRQIQPGAIRRIAEQLGVYPEALRTWVKRAESDEGLRPGTASGDEKLIAELEREVRELRRANGILKSGVGFLCGGAGPSLPVADTVAFVDEHRDRFGVELGPLPALHGGGLPCPCRHAGRDCSEYVLRGEGPAAVGPEQCAASN